VDGVCALKVVDARAERQYRSRELARPDSLCCRPYQQASYLFGTEIIVRDTLYSLVGAAQQRTDRYIIAVKREPRDVVRKLSRTYASATR
jgi:hypothetical protein